MQTFNTAKLIVVIYSMHVRLVDLFIVQIRKYITCIVFVAMTHRLSLAQQRNRLVFNIHLQGNFKMVF